MHAKCGMHVKDISIIHVCFVYTLDCSLLFTAFGTIMEHFAYDSILKRLFLPHYTEPTEPTLERKEL